VTAAALAAGIDIGGTKLLGMVVDEIGHPVRVERRPTPYDNEGLMAALIGLAEDLRPWDALGVGVAGLVTPEGVLRAAPNLGAVGELAVRPRLEAALGHAVGVENDATCAAVAEWRLGAARGARNAVVVTLGTGIGGGVIANGRLVRGANGFAGEPGHMVVDPDGPDCVCGRRGCWERYSSGAGLARWANAADRAPVLRRALGRSLDDPAPLLGEDVMVAARVGDRTALEIVDEFCRWTAVGLVNLTNLLDPEVLVIGGGLARAADVIAAPLQRWFVDLLYSPEHRPHPRLAIAQLGEQAGALGAALLAAGRW
jgi:glucokinase